jgi:hypothetical protein
VSHVEDTGQQVQVAIGTRVEIELISESGEAEHLAFDIVTDAEADFARGHLGVTTPLARAIVGHTAGSRLPYRVGDAVEVRILSVDPPKDPPSTTTPPPDLEAQRQAIISKAVARSEVLNDVAFALAAGSKWGDYDPEAVPPERRIPSPKSDAQG